MSSPALIPALRTVRSSAIFVALVVTLSTLSGCAHLATFYNGLFVRIQEKHDLANVRQDTRQALAQQEQEAQRLTAQREVEQARLSAEQRRIEMELCRANQEALQQQVRSNLKNVLESKVAFNVEHGLEVGELEVDTEALQQLLKAREQAPPQAPVQRPPCPCCDQPCGCGSGFIRRLCPHCRHKPCECEQKCGGPETYAQLQQAPLKQPLRPAEIPMKLPVRLSYGFQQPIMENARVRTQPVTNLPVLGPCQHGNCPCTSPAAPGQAYGQPSYSAPAASLPPRGADEADAPPPPTPTADQEARTPAPPAIPIPSIHLGMAQRPL
jgi:hypothetical protein